MENKLKIDISTYTIIKIIAAVFAVWLLFKIKDIVVLFFIVLVIVAALKPLVDRMSKYIPRILSLIILITVFIGFLVLVGFLIVPPILGQIEQLIENFPIILDRFNPVLSFLRFNIANNQESINNISSQLGSVTSGIYTTTISLFGGVVAFITILVLSFYLLLEQNSIKAFVMQIIPNQEERVSIILNKIIIKMGNWLRGQGLLMLVIGILDGIALVALGVPYALTLGVWGGITEVIPYIGPWLGLIPALIIAYTVSPLKALLVLVIFILIQQLEGQILVPKIMGKAVGLSPVIIILALLIGAKLMGILGMLVAVPVAAAISVIIQEWPEIKKLRNK